MKEKTLQSKIQIALGKIGCRMFRNQVGTYRLKDGRVISSGLCKGSSDLIGITPYKIKNSDVGKVIGVFTAVEVKTPGGRVRKMQENFINFVRATGGIAMISHDVESPVQRIKALVS